MPVVLLQGPSGAGKTYLGNRLSKDLGVPFIGKDTIKELLFDELGHPINREVNYAYGRIATSAIFSIIKEYCQLDMPLIIDCAFYAKEAAEDMEGLGIYMDDLLQIYVTAPPSILMERFNNRLLNGERHVGHKDMTKNSVKDFIEYTKRYSPLDISRTISIDTSESIDDWYKDLRGGVSKFLNLSV